MSNEEINTPEYFTSKTAPELREILKAYYGKTGLSKVRKSDLVTMLIEAREARLTEIEVEKQGAVQETAKAFGDLSDAAHSAVQGLRDAFVPAMQQVGAKVSKMFATVAQSTRNEEIFVRRFLAKRVTVTVNRRSVGGRVVERTQRHDDNGMPELLLFVKHANDAGHPRVTLHRAEDVTLAS